MTASITKAKKLATSLLRANRLGRSWRTIAHEDYADQVNHATLNRIAIHKGDWLPKDETILKALGLITPRSPFAGLPKWFVRTDDALSFFNRQRAKVKEMGKATRQAVVKAKMIGR